MGRAETKAWLQSVLEATGFSPTQLARSAGVAPSTINRFLNDPDATHDLSRRTLEAISTVTGIEPFTTTARRAPAPISQDAVQFDPEQGTGQASIDAAVRAACKDRERFEAWILQGRVLEHAGFLPGDILIVDLLERPRPKDAVAARVFDWATGRGDTVMRLYQPPYLLAASSDLDSIKPLVVDEDTVAIRGVVVASFRPRRAPAFTA